MDAHPDKEILREIKTIADGEWELVVVCVPRFGTSALTFWPRERCMGCQD